ncbi:ribonuclease H2, subunit B [Melanogaster broomeanus]|nr:ribonuclease H2, subunit B [Melanogaster broomeanus]
MPSDIINTVAFQLSDPDNTTARSPRFLRLPHPRTGAPCRAASLFLAHEADTSESEDDGKRVSKILEVQAGEPPNKRSWFIGDEVVSGILSLHADGKLLVMTPVDPIFLLDTNASSNQAGSSGIVNFRPAEDMFEDAARHIAEASTVTASQDASTLIRVEDVMKFAALECTKSAMKRICDVKGRLTPSHAACVLTAIITEITSEITVFRYSSEKLMQCLRRKVATLSTPHIMEMSRSLIRNLAKDALMEDKNEGLLDLGRTKLACELLAQYLPQDIREELGRVISSTFLPFHDEQLMLPPDSGAITKKSKGSSATLSEDGKKRKRDGKGSHGVEKLKKANVGGMSKLSTFFTKKTA